MGVLALPTLLAALLGLIGVVVGALVTGWAQDRNARQARRAVADAAIHDAVRELVATSDIVEGFYSTLWQLDRGGEHDPPESAFARALEAWANYQHARARVRVLAPDSVISAAAKLNGIHYEENTAIELFYLRATDNDGNPLSFLREDQVEAYRGQIHEQQQRLIAAARRTVRAPGSEPEGERAPRRRWWPRRWSWGGTR